MTRTIIQNQQRKDDDTNDLVDVLIGCDWGMCHPLCYGPDIDSAHWVIGALDYGHYRLVAFA